MTGLTGGLVIKLAGASDAAQGVSPEVAQTLKTLFVSGYTAHAIARHGVLDKGLDFIEKPFSRNNLLARVRQILDTAV